MREMPTKSFSASDSKSVSISEKIGVCHQEAKTDVLEFITMKTDSENCIQIDSSMSLYIPPSPSSAYSSRASCHYLPDHGARNVGWGLLGGS